MKIIKIYEKSKLVDIINAPEFEEFGQFLFPTGYRNPYSGQTLDEIGHLLPWHSYINTENSIEILDYMQEKVNEGKQIFYDIYTEEEKQKNSSKRDTGLFFFRGKKDAPFAVVNAGGGFVYVGSIHESFPHAMYLSKKGYNAFALQYRTTGAQAACEDLAAAISFIFRNKEMLGVSTECYSLWGGSAGARMAAYLGTYGPAGFGGDRILGPKTIVMQYTGHSEYSRNDPPTYVCVGTNDYIASWQVMQRRLKDMSDCGIDTEFHKYKGMPHGFGLGIGTVAEGWIDDAISFWERQMKDTKR
ncbi:hypothetical protein CDLVIII_2514 [Clostridium sp. DL-VIII]|uniref:alpha/beta hydrolase n=1 Tax=Clostridium sp. DL-VIII TaxID=641107 RepID=UPI00023B0029|nr:alpha/beta hydrolase [Clostridium sp. DL-VIII]EHI99145.1 hypothetical protein CDLVIII_2514 [Clostridium sp. DL-VIII]